MKKFLLFYGLLMILVPITIGIAKAQGLQDFMPKIEEPEEKVTDTLGRIYDKAEMQPRSFSNDLSDTYSGPDFDYVETKDDSENFLSGFFNGIFDFIRTVFGIDVSPEMAELIKILVYIIVGAFAVYFIIRLLNKESANTIVGRSKNRPVSVSIEDTHIEELDLETLIKESINSGNYRQAIRYMYLETLKLLSSTGRIDWDQQKTNGDYLREIKNPATKEKFKRISYLYDHIWYGEFDLDAQGFEDARGQFNSIKTKMA